MLNPPSTQLPDPCFQQLLDVSADIVNYVQIQANFCITHPHYPPLELAAEVIARLQQLPMTLQQKYLNLQLRNFLYDIYFTSEQRMNTATAADSPLDCPLENNRTRGLDLEFYQRLHNSNSGKGFFDSGWFVLTEERDRTLAVKKQGLTLHIDRDRHLHLAQQSASMGDWVAIRMPSNRVEAGFYVAVGNAGFIDDCDQNDRSERVEIFFNLSPEGAIALMQAITQQLNNIDIPFTFRALSDPANYGRSDAGVLCFDQNNYEVVRQVLQTVYPENQLHFQPSTPLFTKLLAPGLGLAESPTDELMTPTSFGMNRCQIVANGLLAAWQTGNSPADRMNAIRQQFSQLGLDWYRPYLNPDAQDIYTPLDL
ncbi:MAG: hypothetical protein HC851_00130 [Acaryochloris sp. RU_4_1]|nr:hypothetical protein [Acaryochloris sp. RU_4_1]NJR53273.1 hypothetical protein [Acaryochloris sp. CRU_2_0]